MIRPFKPEDLPTVIDIANEAWQSIYDAYERDFGREFVQLIVPDRATSKGERVKAHCEQHPQWVWVYEDEQTGEIAGFVTSHLDTGRKIGVISNNAVRPTHRGRGIATRMYRKVLDVFREQGMRLARVATGLDDGHAPARKAYENVGFDIEWKTINYYMEL